MSHFTRRDFLGGTLASGMVLAGTGGRCWAAPFSKPIGANNDIRVAILGMGGPNGVGGRGRQLIGYLKDVPGVKITALCDVDEVLLDREYEKLDGQRNQIKKYRDLRKVYDDPQIDAVFIALPNHWHALATIWACQAGKDVYVEKPASHNIWEGRQMVNAARKHNRIVQTGTQARSGDVESQIAEYIQSHQLGDVQYAHAVIYRRRESIGKVDGPQSIPSSVDYNLWLGPAPKTELLRKELHYLWHWVWSTGNGEIGNNGVHQLDKCRWILGHSGLPHRVMSVGGRFQFKDDGQTPNTQIAFLDYESAPILCEVRNLPKEKGTKKMDNFHGAGVGTVFHCEGGSVVNNGQAATAYNTEGEEIKKFKNLPESDSSIISHLKNFVAAVRSRKAEELNAEILDGHLSAALCHMANTSHRLGSIAQPGAIAERTQGNPQYKDAFERFQQHAQQNDIDLQKTPAVLGPWLTIDSKSEQFVGDFAEPANQLQRREYRKPFAISEDV